MNPEDTAKILTAEMLEKLIRLGFEMKPARTAFLLADIHTLQDVVADWIEEHMEAPARAEVAA